MPLWGVRQPDPDQAPKPWRDNLPDLLSALRQRRRTLLATILLVPLCAIMVLRQVTPLYTASGALVYQASQYQSRELESMMRTDPVTEATMATQAEMLQSLRIAEQVAQRGKLFDSPAFNPALRPAGALRSAVTALRRMLEMDDEETPTDPVYGPVLDLSYNTALLAVQASLHASPVRFSHIVEVTFIADDPMVAAAAVNNAMDAYIKGLYADKYQKIEQGTAHLDAQAKDLRRVVQRLEEKISGYRADHGLSHGIHAGTDTEQITRLSEDLVKALGERAAADARLDAARGGKGASAQAAVAPSVVQLRAQQDQLAAQIQSQQARLGAAHPEAQGLARQFAEGQRALTAEAGRVVASIEAEQRAASDRVTTLERNLHEAQQAADQAARDSIPLNAMTRDLDAARSQLNAVLEAVQQTAHQTSIEFPEAHEITQALPPSQPSYPRKAQTIAAAAAAGVFLGLLLVYVLQLADDTVRNGDAIRFLTGVPCFALIPEMRKRTLGHLQIHEYAARRPLTAYAEQIRALRASVCLEADRPKVITITAARPAEGKSVLALSMGRSAQAAGERVLAIECDVRQPSFRRRLGGQPQPGLLDILRGEVEWRDTVQDDPVTGMGYITAGKMGKAGSAGADVLALFLSDEMRRLLAEARDDYDLILLDAPPVEALTEARVAATLSDAALLCVRWRSTRTKTLMHALEVLRDAHAKVIGTVLTRVDAREHLRSGDSDSAVYHRRYKAYFRG